MVIIAAVLVPLALMCGLVVVLDSHIFVTITDMDYSAGYHAWRHEESNTELGTFHDDGERIYIHLKEKRCAAPSGSWRLAEKQFMKMMHAHVIWRKDTKRLIWVARRNLPKKVTDWENANRRSLYSWI